MNSGLYAICDNSRHRNLLIHGLLALLLVVGIVLVISPSSFAQTTGYSITVNASTGIQQINPDFFGCNVHGLHLKCLFIDPLHPEAGYRQDMLNLIQNLPIKTVRFPAADVYHWRYGVGPVSQRKPIQTVWESYIPYFSTDEFAQLCEMMGWNKRIICANYLTGTPQEAANWVEYCNIPVPSTPDPSWTASSYDGADKAPKGYFAWLRGHFGHLKPYNIKYWEIGNEIYYSDSLAQERTPEQYASDFQIFADAMKAVDPTIKIGLNVDGKSDWNETVISIAGSKADFLCPHYYSALHSHPMDLFYGNDSRSRDVYFPQSVDYTFSITAGGKSYQGSGPHMVFLIDGIPITDWEVANNPTVFTCTTSVTRGYHKIGVAFDNDWYDPATGLGRDLYLYKVTAQTGTLPEQSLWYPEGTEQLLLFSDNSMISGRTSTFRDLCKLYAPGRDIQIQVNEGSLNYMDNSNNEVRSSLRMKSALWLSMLLNTLIKDNLSNYCHWNLCDDGYFGIIRDPRLTVNNTPSVTPCYQVLQIYGRLQGGWLLKAGVTSPTENYPENTPTPFNMPVPTAVPYIDAIACRNGTTNTVFLIVTNRCSANASTAVTINGFFWRSASATTLKVTATAPHPNAFLENPDLEMEAYNETKMISGVSVQPDTIKLSKTGLNIRPRRFTYTFPPYSITLIELK